MKQFTFSPFLSLLLLATAGAQSLSQQYGPPGYTPGKPLGLDELNSAPKSTAPKSCPPNDPAKNKELVLQAYQEVFGDHKLENLEKYFAQDYIQHNPMATDGRDGLKELIKSVPDPPQKIDFKRSVAGDDLVWTHSQIKFFGMTYAAVDIFRVECGQIKEHWDVLQDTMLTMPSRNNHPFF